MTSGHQFQTESKLTFNGGNSVMDQVTTNDGFGRTIFSQEKQGPAATNYDTVATCYNSSGQVNLTTLAYSAALVGSGTAACPTGNAGKSYTYDGLGRQTQVSDSGGGYTSFTYRNNDVYQSLGPKPTHGTENTKDKQLEYDALGRLASVCEITSGTTSYPGGTCGQTNSQTGYYTTYSYNALDNLTGVTQNAQASSPKQTRSFNYDMLGRMTSEANPESGTTQYSWDTASSACGGYSSAGDLLTKQDANGASQCYGYDVLHRLAGVGVSDGHCRGYIYDSATPPTGVTVSNGKGRLIEAYTNSACDGHGSIVTDEWYSYSPRGELTDVYESTPHSGGYYHVSSQYWENGATKNIGNISGLPTISFGLDGEGRINTVSASSGQTPVSSASYNPAGQGLLL